MNWLGGLGALFIGFILGVNGSGGAILTVPILVYIFGQPMETASSYSLAIVGLTAAVGFALARTHKPLAWGATLSFALPSVVASFLVRVFLISLIPPVLFTIGGYSISKHTALLLLFAMLMFWAAWAMLSSTPIVTSQDARYSTAQTVFRGAGVGVVTGLLGAGGGFMIVPALVLGNRLPIQEAVVLSLFIVTLNSAVGFLGDLSRGANLDWLFLAEFSALTIIGVYVGVQFSHRLDGKKLKKLFGIFIIIMSAFIISKELIFR